MAVLKADGYGLGAARPARALAAAGADRFGAAELNEALALLPTGRPVQILGGILPDEIPEAVARGVILPLTDEPTARRISAEAVRQQRTVPCHILLDTGMGRLGVLPHEAVPLAETCRSLPGIRLEGLYSHFPVAYRSGEAFTTRQIRLYRDILDRLAKKNITFDWRHIANSDAINNFPETFAPPFNAVRTGINLHGSFDTEGRRALDLRPILTLKTVLAAVRRLPAGMSIGYGQTYTLPRETRVGTISAGYADGLPLARVGILTLEPDAGHRGGHWHRHKCEGFYVFAGRARVELACPFTREKVELILDVGYRLWMRPLLAHRITALKPLTFLEFCDLPYDRDDDRPYDFDP